MTAPRTVLALSRAPRRADFVTPRHVEGWFDLAPWDEGTVDYILCDDVSEWPPEAVQTRLLDIRRILRRGGVLRLVTEDLDQVVHGYLLGWPADDAGASPARRFNAWLQGAAGRFIYNEAELSTTLSRTGYSDIQRFVSGASAHEVFWTTVTDDARVLVLEARRPIAGG